MINLFSATVYDTGTTTTMYQPPPPPSGHMSAEEMDQQRKQNIAYEYLCHLEESKVYV